MSSKKKKQQSPVTPNKSDNNSNNLTNNNILYKKDVTIILQNNINNELECTSNKLLMHYNDLRSLQLSYGSLIQLNSNTIDCPLIFEIWPSKQQTNGYIVLNKIWNNNFNNNIKIRKGIISKLDSNYIIQDCQLITLRNNDLSNNLLKNSYFISYINYSLRNVLFIYNDYNQIQLTIYWQGKPYIFFIDSLQSKSIDTTNDSKYIIRINESTKINLTNDTINNNSTILNQAMKSIDSYISNINKHFGGYKIEIREACVTTLLSIYSSNQSNHFKHPRGILLYGPSGTGKSKLANLLANQLAIPVVKLSTRILTYKNEGEAEAECIRLVNLAIQLSPSVLLIEDIEKLFPDRSLNNQTIDNKQILSCFLSLIDGLANNHQRFIIISTSNQPQLIDRALRRPGRLDKEIELTIPSATDRYDILTVLLNDLNITYPSNYLTFEGVKRVADITHGMVGSDLLQVIKESYLISLYNNKSNQNSLNDLTNRLSKISINQIDSNNEHIVDNKLDNVIDSNIYIINDDLLKASKKISPSALREISIEIPNVKWTDIGGMESVKQSLKEVVEWPLQYPHLFDTMGITPPKGVLLYGPPGCSKTLMAKALATESEMNFLAVRGPELLSKWLGESEKAIQTLFKRARAAAPSIIFFDEIDALTGKRGESNNGVSDRVLSQLLTELDGVQGLKRVVVIAATNRPDMMDPALLRPGRIDRKIYVYPPDSNSREKILSLQLSKIPTDESINIQELVDMTNGFSGAEVVAICQEASYIAMDNGSEGVSQSNLVQAINETKPQINEKMIQFYENIQNNFII